MLEGDILYVKGALNPGQSYGLYRPGWHTRTSIPASRWSGGNFVGTVRAEEYLAHDTTKVTLTHNRREVYQGDKVMPLPSQESISAVFMPKAAPSISPAM